MGTANTEHAKRTRKRWKSPHSASSQVLVLQLKTPPGKISTEELTKPLEENTNSPFGIQFFLFFCYSFPILWIYCLPALSDEQPLSKTSVREGQQLLTVSPFSFYELPVWPCLPLKGLMKITTWPFFCTREGGIAAQFSSPMHSLFKCGVSLLFFNSVSSTESHRSL